MFLFLYRKFTVSTETLCVCIGHLLVCCVYYNQSALCLLVSNEKCVFVVTTMKKSTKFVIVSLTEIQFLSC